MRKARQPWTNTIKSFAYLEVDSLFAKALNHLYDDPDGFFHPSDYGHLIGTVEIHTAHKEVRRWQPHKRQLRTIRAPARRFHVHRNKNLR